MIGALLVLVTLGRVVVAPYTIEDRSELNICETTECIEEASRILNSMDTSVDPCNNFYRYSCGGWVRDNPIPRNESVVNQFRWTSGRDERRLKDILSTDHSQDHNAIRKAKEFYKLCIDEDAIEERGGSPALDLIQQLRGMPVLDGDSPDHSFILETYLAETKIEEKSPVIDMTVRIDDINSSRNIIAFEQPSLIMPSAEYYLSPRFKSARAAYRRFLRNFINELRRSQVNAANVINERSITQAVEEILQFETDLAKIIVPDSERTDILMIYNRLTVEEMSRSISSDFNWLEYVKGVLARVGATAGSREEVVVLSKPYYSQLPSLLKRYNARIIKNYVVSYTLAKHVDLLSKRFRDTEVPYRKAIMGTTKESSRWQNCIKKTKELLKMAVGALYAKTLFSEQRKKEALEMVDNILMSFKDDLQKIDWMDRETKRAALVKVDKVNKLIGYPDYIVEDESGALLDEEYADVELVENKYFESVIGIHALQLQQSLNKLNNPVDREHWSIGPADVNAFYEKNSNSMIFPAAILQTPFFSHGRPYAMNYGAIGNAAGHELTHGFDTTGSRYNENGNLENWWSNFSRRHFDKASTCFKNQYSSFYYEPAKMYVNGNSTIRENIADNGGIRSAYNGYQLWKGINPGIEFHLPGLEQYTMEQLFFVAYAQVWCASERPARSKLVITKFPHSPPVFRAEGPLRNFDKFGEAFECRIGEDELYPNPTDTCRVW